MRSTLLFLSLLVTALALTACSAGTPNASPGHEFLVDCTDCPVLVMGQPDTEAWKRVNEGTVPVEDIIVLVGCHYGYRTADVNAKFGLRDRAAHATELSKGEHLALVWPTEGMHAGDCYAMTVRHARQVGRRNLPAPQAVHYFNTIEIKPLTKQSRLYWSAQAK